MVLDSGDDDLTIARIAALTLRNQYVLVEVTVVGNDNADAAFAVLAPKDLDGWRVVKFPELALMMDESRTYGLGFEFILERSGGVR